MESQNRKYMFETIAQCEIWLPKLNQDQLNYLYTVDKFVAEFKPETQVKLRNIIPDKEIPKFLKCLSFILVTCNLNREFQFHDDFTRVQRYEVWPDRREFKIAG